MAIPSDVLKSWTKSPSDKQAIEAHTTIRDWLRRAASRLDPDDFEDRLQGSYVNDTSVPGDRDVDIVVELTRSFRSNKHSLPADQYARFKSDYDSASYSLSDFRADVLAELYAGFGEDRIEIGNNAVKVRGIPGKSLDADVVICIEYRLYWEYKESFADTYAKGIAYNRQDDDSLVTNYPQLHYDNGVDKNHDTDGLFKPCVRMFKSARNYMVDHGYLDEGVAPSYFLQGLLYNVPDSHYDEGITGSFLNILGWLYEPDKPRSEFMCQNGITRLFGGTREQWSEEDFDAFTLALGKLYLYEWK